MLVAQYLKSGIINPAVMALVSHAISESVREARQMGALDSYMHKSHFPNFACLNDQKSAFLSGFCPSIAAGLRGKAIAFFNRAQQLFLFFLALFDLPELTGGFLKEGGWGVLPLFPSLFSFSE